MSVNDREIEHAGAFTIELLRLCNECDHLRDLARGLTACFQSLTGCQAVGLRLSEGDDFPYYETRGFPAEFVRAENRLCAPDIQGQLQRDEAGHPILECMCGNILCGRFDPSKPFFTPRGSFWTNCTTELLAGTTEGDRQSRTRNRCNGEGYESVALIPLHSRGKVIGLLQFNDRRKDRFTADRIALLEHLADYATVGIAKLQADETTREALQRVRLATAAARLAVWDWHISTDTLFWDRLGSEIHGVAPDLNSAPLQFWRLHVHPDDRDRVDETVRAVLRDGRPFDLRYRAMRPDGVVRDVRVHGDVVRDHEGRIARVIGLARDITDQLKLEAQLRESEHQLRQAQKLESVGRLAGGIAHDFNNLLTPILAYSDLFLSELPPGDPRRESMQEIHRAGARARDLTRQLLAFGRRQVLSLESVDLRDVLSGFEKLLRHTLREDIRVDISLPPALALVRADIGQIEQVLLNLALNAQDAMPQGGSLRLEVADVLLDEAAARQVPDARPGRYVLLEVADTGCGMDPATLEHLFEPFFTTKGKGKGTGLGLCTSYGIIRQHGGVVAVRSEPGAGSVFRVYLPAVECPGDAPAQPEPAPNGLPRGVETVLVVEDNDIVRQMTADILTSLGYQVIVAKGADHCRVAMYGRPGPVHLLLADVVMPGMDGRRLYDFIRSYHPAVRVLYMSGYAPEIIAQHGILESGVAFIQKPFSAQALAQKVRQVLA